MVWLGRIKLNTQLLNDPIRQNERKRTAIVRTAQTNVHPPSLIGQFGLLEFDICVPRKKKKNRSAILKLWL